MCSFDFHILSRTSTAFRWTRGGTAIGSQEADLWSEVLVTTPGVQGQTIIT